MTDSQRPAPLKRQITLKLSNLPSAITNSIIPGAASAPINGPRSLAAASPTAQTPSSGPPKIKLVRKSLPPTPSEIAAQALPKLKTPHKGAMPPPKPPASILNESEPPLKASASADLPKLKMGRVQMSSIKKRAKREESSDDDTPLSKMNGSEQKAKRIKLVKTPVVARVPTLKLKQKANGRIPPRSPGDGFDSEAEDREVDPVLQDQVVLRMYPGEPADYLNRMLQEKKMGLPRAQGGADIQFKWLDEEPRRAMVTVLGQPYAAVLVDLPTITESMKTWDRKNMVKSADICQMLLVHSPVISEEEARTAPLPQPVDVGYRWPHGLTPPMHDARNRRFRKRLSKLEIQNKEAEVQRLLVTDSKAQATEWKYVDDNDEDSDEERERMKAEEEQMTTAEYGMGDEDAEGEDDGEQEYFGPLPNDINEEDLLAMFHGAEPGLAPADASTPASAAMETPTADPGAGVNDADDEEEDEEESDDEDDYDDDEMEGVEEDGDENAGVRTEISELKKKLTKLEADLASNLACNASIILRRRIEDSIKATRDSIKLKQALLGEELDED